MLLLFLIFCIIYLFKTLHSLNVIFCFSSGTIIWLLLQIWHPWSRGPPSTTISLFHCKFINFILQICRPCLKKNTSVLFITECFLCPCDCLNCFQLKCSHLSEANYKKKNLFFLITQHISWIYIIMSNRTCILTIIYAFVSFSVIVLLSIYILVLCVWAL